MSLEMLLNLDKVNHMHQPPIMYFRIPRIQIFRKKLPLTLRKASIDLKFTEDRPPFGVHLRKKAIFMGMAYQA
ncbi:hypothetical protein J23TS9_58470 [Paenibacillus sp. J23TS9]|nr:hypothetical protein J23TS9_58470 [Paenibacillus sp. J23TS9]